MTCRNSSIVKNGRLGDWEYRYERRTSEEGLWDADGCRRYVPEGPYVSEWGSSGNQLVLRPDAALLRTKAVGTEDDYDVTQGSLCLDDAVVLGPTKSERRKEKWRRVLKSIEENPF